MTTITYTDGHAAGIFSRLAAAFRAVGRHFMAARENEARRYVGTYLATLDEATLKRLGLSRADVARMPKAPYIV